MSKTALNALKATGLLDKNGKAISLDGINPIELQKRIDYYRETRINYAEKDAVQSTPSTRDLSALVSSVSASNAVNSLLPSCFVYNRLYANDPLIQFASNTSQIAKAHNESLGLGSDSVIDPVRLANKLLFFEKMAPLIDLGCLSVLPLEELHAPPGDGIPMTYSEDWFRSEVPAHIHNFVHKNAIVSEMQPGPGGKGLIILDAPPDSPTRGICVQFHNDYSVRGSSLYLLYEMEVLEELDEQHFRIAQRLDWENPPTKTMYDAWVYQSINKAIIARIDSVSREMGLAQHLGCSYLTESEFEATICGMTSDSPTNDNQSINAVNFLHANSSLLRLDDPLILARLRQDHWRIFERWQLSLLSICDELQGAGDDFQTKANQMFEKEVQPQLDELRSALVKLSGGITGASLLTAGTIGMALLSTPTLPFAAILALGAVQTVGESMPSLAEFLARRKGPSFIWNKLTK